MRADAEQRRSAADADPLAVKKALDRIGLAPAVALDRDHLEADHDAAPVRQRIGRRKIAQDAAPDFAQFRLDRDPLGDEEIAVGLHVDFAVEQPDTLDTRGRVAEHREQKERNKESADHPLKRRLTSRRTPAAASAARRTAAARTARRAGRGRCRRNCGSDRAAEMAGKPGRIAAPVALAVIPGVAGGTRRGCRRQYPRELLAPFVLDIERNRIGQEFLEQLRRLLRRMHEVQLVLFRDAEIFPEARDLVADLLPFVARRLQQIEAEQRQRKDQIAGERGDHQVEANAATEGVDEGKPARRDQEPHDAPGDDPPVPALV